MTEGDARAWCAARTTPVQFERLERFADMVIAENSRQNLISPATCDVIWSRHITDSAQLALHCPAQARTWLDIGTGPGFPGLVIAMICDLAATLVEPRTRRVDFLNEVATALDLKNVTVKRAKAEAIDGRYDVISARAVANIPNLLAMTRHLGGASSRLLLPRGRNGATEVAELPANVRHMFHVEPSITDPDSVIVIADGVMA